MSDLPPFELGYARTKLRRKLVDAVLSEAKTATAGLPELGEAPVEPGSRFLLLGYDDEPVGIVEVTESKVIPAAEIDEQFAREEGEGFDSVEQWRVAHERFFERPITPDTPVLAERFRLVERL